MPKTIEQLETELRQKNLSVFWWLITEARGMGKHLCRAAFNRLPADERATCINLMLDAGEVGERVAWYLLGEN
jgi:hypothetical protein